MAPASILASAVSPELDAAHADQRQLPARQPEDAGEQTRRAQEERPSREPARLRGKAPIVQPVAGERGVGHDEAVHAMGLHHAQDLRHIVIGEVGGELDEKRRLAGGGHRSARLPARA